MSAFLERTTGFEPATPTLAMLWEMSIASPPVSAVPLSCTFVSPIRLIRLISRRSSFHFVGDFVGENGLRGLCLQGGAMVSHGVGGERRPGFSGAALDIGAGSNP